MENESLVIKDSFANYLVHGLVYKNILEDNIRLNAQSSNAGLICSPNNTLLSDTTNL